MVKIIFAFMVGVAVSAMGWFSGVEFINHSGGPAYVSVTCFESGHTVYSGVLADGERQALRMACPKE